MTDKQIIIDDYFTECTDEGGGTIGYHLISETALIKKIREQNAYIQAKEQECERLKEEIAKATMEICNQCGEKDDYNIPCKQIRDLDYGLQLEIEENDKLKQTLVEIKEIAEDFGFNGTYESYKTAIEQILQKISEVIKDEEV